MSEWLPLIKDHTYLVTGSAGFIGYHVSHYLLSQGAQVIGLDNYNDYYSPILKQDRDRQLRRFPQFNSIKADLTDLTTLDQLFRAYQPQKICHMAAQAGVRYSLINPFAYQKANLEGFLNLLELCKRYTVERLVYASSSSVYGGQTDLPYREEQRVDTPISLYAATKKANELMAHVYSHLYSLPTVGLRFFTVYGPWGRPDMAMWLFTEAMLAGRPIKVFNYGHMRRDFTYIDDIVQGVVAALLVPDLELYEIFNLGNHQAEELQRVITLLENELKIKAIQELLPIQPGDVPATFAEIRRAQAKLAFQPATAIETGIPRFVQWYLTYHNLSQRQ
ncbi:MAG: NAD-dependent epimerase/dehydratase family protein [Deltaproteobacteria bacterium]|nr:NAD-dependent epimerase/dehydratase family protein [Deltaproteobacteria bacterium]MBW1952595.1 NAD-dependent epimerase/dehydratase family protein [Deltaproteobacteria bacterium]MBW1987158.1 NAD-dependent epimerase/dehydratase family protein [Deltaproteobacteria bacterium]MBW2133912.1 NAD-dependent epimerase/dehydratase family protein [Deltaproteobacteria bacterium]